MNFDMFDPVEEDDEFSPETDEFGQPIMDKNGQPLPKGSLKDNEQFDAEKAENVAANEKMKSRRANLSPYIEKFRATLMAMFHNDPEPADLYTALELLYDWTLAKLEASLNKTYEEAKQWLRVANDLIAIDEYALMESVEDMIHSSPHSAIRSALEQQYSNILRSARGDVGKEAAIFTEIAFALVGIVEDQIAINPDDAEDYIEIKETIDRKYGPLFKGLENQVHDLGTTDRRYGRFARR